MVRHIKFFYQLTCQMDEWIIHEPVRIKKAHLFLTSSTCFSLVFSLPDRHADWFFVKTFVNREVFVSFATRFQLLIAQADMVQTKVWKSRQKLVTKTVRCFKLHLNWAYDRFHPEMWHVQQFKLRESPRTDLRKSNKKDYSWPFQNSVTVERVALKILCHFNQNLLGRFYNFWQWM